MPKIILGTIISRGTVGISRQELIRVTGINRTTIYRVTEPMSKKGLIKLTRKGRTVNYVARDQTLHDISLSGLLLSNDFIAKILGSKEGWVNELHLPRIFNSYTNRPHVTDIDGKFVKKLICEISNRIGAYLTFIFLQSMNPDTISRIPRNLLKETTISSAGAGNIISQEWVKSALLLSPKVWIEKIAEFFRTYGFLVDPWHLETRRRLLDPNLSERERKSILKQIQSDSGFVQQKKDISILLKSFSEIYPKINKELEQSMHGLPREVDVIKDYFEDLEKRSLMQTNCKHQFGKSVLPLSGIGRIRKCTQCGYEKRIKPHSERNSQSTNDIGV